MRNPGGGKPVWAVGLSDKGTPPAILSDKGTPPATLDGKTRHFKGGVAEAVK